MSARAPRRLPGFRFETQAPPLPEVLPRMDIAVFVGFAASGPLQTPVAVESEPQFAAIFGDEGQKLPRGHVAIGGRALGQISDRALGPQAFVFDIETAPPHPARGRA